MKDFDHLVYYLILYMYALTNFSTGKNYTVFDHGILVNNAATAENGILNGSLHLTAVGNDRVANLGEIGLYTCDGKAYLRRITDRNPVVLEPLTYIGKTIIIQRDSLVKWNKIGYVIKKIRT